MDNKKRSIAKDEGMKNWVQRRKFQDFCNDNSICTVLLIADNPFIVQYFKLLFNGCNCKFMSVHNGDNAISKIENSGGADIVMVDNDLPHVDSAGLRRAIKKVWPNMKVIDVRSPLSGRMKYKSAGPASYIEKPFDVNSVVKTITSTVAG
jgi:DNA-binding NtrC family response regulator